MLQHLCHLFVNPFFFCCGPGRTLVNVSQTGRKRQRPREKNLFLAMVTKICNYGIIVAERLPHVGDVLYV